MNLEERDESAERFAAYVDGLTSVIGKRGKSRGGQGG